MVEIQCPSVHVYLLRYVKSLSYCRTFCITYYWDVEHPMEDRRRWSVIFRPAATVKGSSSVDFREGKHSMQHGLILLIWDDGQGAEIRLQSYFWEETHRQLYFLEDKALPVSSLIAIPVTDLRSVGTVVLSTASPF
jgi:hypothetical protein